MTRYYGNGIGGTVGDVLDTCLPLMASGQIWYVSSLIGVDAVSPQGLQRDKPLATMAQAVTNAADDDIIVFLQGHTETIAATQTVAKRLSLVGEGNTSGKPGASLRYAGGAQAMFSVSAASVEFRNIYFPPAATPTSGVRMNMSGVMGAIRGCYFEFGSTDQANGVLISASQLAIDGSTFVSVATSRTAQPTRAIAANSFVLTDITLSNTIISNGTVGFSAGAAVSTTSATSLAAFKGLNVSLLLGADIDMLPAATGYINVQTATGGSRVQW